MPKTCPSCGHSVVDPGALACPNCGTMFSVDEGPADSPPPPADSAPPPPPPAADSPPPGAGGTPPPPAVGGSSVPFDDTSQPLMSRLVETIKLAFSDPVRLFSNMPSEDIGPPVIYGTITGTITILASLAWQMMFGGLAALGEVGGGGEFAITTGILVMFAIFSPAFAVVGLFISAAIYHVVLLLFGAGRNGFGVTLRAVTYGGTPNLLSIVPFCGGIVGGI